jgi:hypothetical protein
MEKIPTFAAAFGKTFFEPPRFWGCDVSRAKREVEKNSTPLGGMKNRHTFAAPSEIRSLNGRRTRLNFQVRARPGILKSVL